MNKEYISATDITACVLEITEKVKKKGITKIVTLSKGGYIPARLLAKYLKIRRIYSVGVEFYKSVNKTIEVPKVYQHLTEDFEDDDVILIVDDITDSGESMKVAYQEVLEHNGKNIITCSMLHKSKSTFIPDYYGKEANNFVWYDMYWE